MRTIGQKYPPNSSFANDVTAAKLKLKNACPDYLDDKIYRLGKQAGRQLRAMFGLKPPTPIVIHALADLHYEATYLVDGKPTSPQRNQCPWKAAQDYVNFKPFEINEHPGQPIRTRSGWSSSSSLSGAGSQKSVRFAQVEAEVRYFDKNASPQEL